MGMIGGGGSANGCSSIDDSDQIFSPPVQGHYWARGGGIRRQAPSLLDLCVRTSIDNVRYIGDVGATDDALLDRILPHCTVDQLNHIEKCTKDRDLTPVTNKLWKRFYEMDFSAESANVIIKRMKVKKVSYAWKKLYEAKLKDVEEAQMKSFDRIKELYKKEDARKQSRQVQICTKVPPSSNKRSWGGIPGISNVKSNIMKKARLEYIKSPEVKNLAAVKRNSFQKSHGVSMVTKPGIAPRKDSSSTSKLSRPAVGGRW